VRNIWISALLFVTYRCAGQTPLNEVPVSLLRANLLRIAAGQAQAEPTVVICLVADPNRQIMSAAETLANQIFTSIRVTIRWHESPVCPAAPEVPVFMVIRTATPKTYFPDALGVALPLEGSHAWVFYDRVQRAVRDDKHLTALLAHVMVHEIAHVLQGINRHSESGILKANWSEREIAQMAVLPLAFTPTDATLIHMGIEDRRTRLVSNRFAEAPTNHSGAISPPAKGALPVR
jgi:hypothetical protein